MGEAVEKRKRGRPRKAETAKVVPMAPRGREAITHGGRALPFSLPEKNTGKIAETVIAFLETLRVPEGPKAGQPLVLAGYQKEFVRGAMVPGVMVGCLSIGRGNAKTALSAGIGLGSLMGVWDDQPKREIILAARNRDQARTAFQFVIGFIEGLSEAEQELFIVRRGAKLEVEYPANGGGLLRVIPADGKSILGGAPTLAILDERAAWEREKGDTLENAILSGLGKRDGRALIISTSAPDDANTFSRWLDEPPPGTYVQEHRPPFGLPADDLPSLLIANPGAAEGIGASADWLVAQARRAIARGGSALSSFRNLNRNERVSTEDRSVVVTVDEWMSAEVDPIVTRPIIDRLFPGSVAAQMGAQLISIGTGAAEWPVTTSAVTAGWANGELANVAGPTTYATTDKALKPEQTLGIHMRVSRKSMLQSGDALEQAIRRDMNGTMGAELDKAIFLGTGATGQPLGVVPGVATYGITSTDAGGQASWAALRAAVVRFMTANAAAGPGAVNALVRPELWNFLDGVEAFAGTGVTEWDRLTAQLGGVVQTANALAAPSGGPPLETQVLLTTNAGGVAPVFVGLWGAVDLIRDPYSDAQSGGLRLTALTTADVTVARGAQLELVTGLELAVDDGV